MIDIDILLKCSELVELVLKLSSNECTYSVAYKIDAYMALEFT